MRAHEALILGSGVMRPAPGIIANSTETAGCALGMIGKATGSPHNWLVKFPWLANKHQCCFTPCCHQPVPVDGSVANVITHIFDVHVFGDQTWTLERLADWINRQDPSVLRTPEVEPVESKVLVEVA